jgi:hypothetical protein
MDVIPPEYDEATKERVYRQEWLEHFHYIGYEAAQRDFPAQYHALFPHGHYRPPVRSAQTPSAGLDSLVETNTKVGEGRAASAVSSHSSAGSSVPPKTQEGSRRVAESGRTEGRDTRSDRERRPQASRRDDRYAARDRDRNDDHSDEERRRRHRRRSSDSPHRSHHHRSHHRSGRDDEHYTGSGGSRRRRRSDERDERKGRYAHEDSGRRSRREEESGTSRSRAYDDRREDALRRRDANYRR